ncbi:MAG: MBL fold metallo-hydrolase [Hyphomonadaceae bacterium]
MSRIGTSSVVFVTLSGLFWGGWAVGSQTPQGQEALANAYEAYASQQSQANQDLFAPNALRALVCGTGASIVSPREQRPCLAVAAAGRLFIVDAGAGAAEALTRRNVPLGRLEAVLLTGADLTRSVSLDELYAASDGRRANHLLPVYGPADAQRLVEGLNVAAGLDGATHGLQAWGPAPEPGRSVIVFEGDGLIVSAFTTREDAFNGRVGYRFDYGGRSLVVGGDGRAEWASAAKDADVVLHGAQTEAFAQLHQGGHGATVAQVAQEARAANAGMVVLSSAEDSLAASMQLNEAHAAGLDSVVAGREGMLLELPFGDKDVNVRPL